MSKFSTALQEELDYRLDLMAETAEEEGEPFMRSDAAIYLAMQDIENADRSCGWWKQFGKEIIAWQIARGVYVPMSTEEIARTTVSRGTAWDFKLAGVPYKFVKHVEAT